MLFAIAKQKKSSAIRPVARPRNYYFSQVNSPGKRKVVKRHGSSSCYLDLWSEKIALDADPDRIGSSFWCLAKALFACQSLYSLINIVSANAKTNTHRSWHEVHRHGRSFEGRKQKKALIRSDYPAQRFEAGTINNRRGKQIYENETIIRCRANIWWHTFDSSSLIMYTHYLLTDGVTFTTASPSTYARQSDGKIKRGSNDE